MDEKRLTETDIELALDYVNLAIDKCIDDMHDVIDSKLKNAKSYDDVVDACIEQNCILIQLLKAKQYIIEQV